MRKIRCSDEKNDVNLDGGGILPMKKILRYCACVTVQLYTWAVKGLGKNTEFQSTLIVTDVTGGTSFPKYFFRVNIILGSILQDEICLHC